MKLFINFASAFRMQRFRSANWCTDDPELFRGIPVCLQLIGGVQEEEAVIAMTEIVDAALKRYKDGQDNSQS